MKVFFVMVLVLVAGAVPSLGRTVSVGTVFNKTQPHESMNNVTISSSKLLSYDYLYLAMQWPKSFCPNRCPQPVPGRFTVHGVWPQRGPFDPPDPSRYFVNCRHRGFPGYNSQQLYQGLVFGLNQYWPNLNSEAAYNNEFWKSEYDKHGSCTFGNENAYFYDSLKAVEFLGDLALRLSLRRPGPIIPGNSYWPDDIRAAVYGVTSRMPRLVCRPVGAHVFLSEIRFCAYAHTVQSGIQLRDCNPYSNCRPGSKVYLPLPEGLYL